MNSDKVIHYSFASDSSEDVKVLAAIAADTYQNYYIVAYDELIANDIMSYIKENATHWERCSQIILERRVFPNTISDFIDDLINLEECSFVEFCLESGLTREIIGLKKNLKKIKVENILLTVEKGSLKYYLHEENISVALMDSYVKVCSLTVNLKREVFQFFEGDSFLKKEENIRRKDSTDLESLFILEYQELLNILKGYSKSEFRYFNNLLMRIIVELKSYTNIIPNEASHVNELSVRNNYNHDAFPSIYKFISILHYESALHDKKMKKSITSFLHAIRSLEVYMDGFLIYAGYAKISDFNSEFNGKKITLKDRFLLENKLVTGISKKLDTTLEVIGLKNSIEERDIKEIVRIRNKIHLTHGDIKICDEICSETIGKITKFIKILEPKDQKNGFEWIELRGKIHNMLSLDFESIVYNTLNDKFNHD